MLIQSSHSNLDRGLDPYFTPPAATFSLLAIEKLPRRIWEPAAGNGAISSILALTHQVYPSDIADYGNPEIHTSIDYLNTDLSFPPDDLVGIVTNPPFKLALQFIQKSLTEVSYSAWLLRTNFLESTSRLPLFISNPPSRIHISSRRLPMMHRHNWSGPTAPSNTCHAWFIWDYRSGPTITTTLHWFDWLDHQPSTPATDPSTLGF